MDAKLTSILRAAGDHFAQKHPEMTLEDERILDPYFPDADDQAPKQTDWTTANGVEALLELVEASSGPAARELIRAALDYRADRFEDGGAYINGLNYGLWTRMAHLALIRALEARHRALRGQAEWLTAREVEARYGLARDSARKAFQRGAVKAERRGRDVIFNASDAEAYWGHRRT